MHTMCAWSSGSIRCRPSNPAASTGVRSLAGTNFCSRVMCGVRTSACDRAALRCKVGRARHTFTYIFYKALRRIYCEFLLNPEPLDGGLTSIGLDHEQYSLLNTISPPTSIMSVVTKMMDEEEDFHSYAQRGANFDVLRVEVANEQRWATLDEEEVGSISLLPSIHTSPYCSSLGTHSCRRRGTRREGADRG